MNVYNLQRTEYTPSVAIPSLKPFLPNSQNVKTDIPKLIHQTSAGTTKDERMKSWIHLNPDYEYKLWSDDDVDKFVKELHPQHYETFSKLPKPVEFL